MSTLDNVKLPKEYLTRRELKRKINKIVDQILIYEMTDYEVTVWNNTGRLDYYIHRMFFC